MWLFNIYLDEASNGRKVYIVKNNGELVKEIIIAEKEYVSDEGLKLNLKNLCDP